MSIVLPKKFIDRSPDQKYKHLEGKEKISYSQVTSWKDNSYRPGYIKQYMCGITLPDGIFANFGSACGTYIEGIATGNLDCHDEYKHLLSDDDRKILENLDYPDNCIYEDYIVIDLGDFVMEGYADRCHYAEDMKLATTDFKTGSIAKKKNDYASLDYKQTSVYSYQKELEGYSIYDSGVILLDRAGNNSPKSPIRLTGKIEYIPTPYDRVATEEFLDGTVRKVVQEISDYYKQYLKLFK